MSLKILFAMMRSPHMCDMFYKTDKKRHSQERLAQLT